MISRTVRVQLVIFTVLSLIASSLIVFYYAGVPGLMGFGKYTVTARFAEGAGLYPAANVTYRGVQIGKVTDVRMGGDGVDAVLEINDGSGLPSNVDAQILSVSPIGEQYVDFTPRPHPGPPMTDGAQIPIQRTKVPKQIAPVLDDVDQLLGSVPKDKLSTVLDEAQQGFQGLGPDLDRLMTSGQDLLAEADRNYGPTAKLINDAEPVLDSQRATSPQIRGWATDLAQFTGAVRQNDSQIRSLLRSVPPAAGQAQGLFNELSANAPALLSSAGVLTSLGAAYHNPLEQLLVAYPKVAVANMVTDAPQRGDQFRLAFKTVANFPGGCSEGWPGPGQPEGPRGPDDLTDANSAKGAYCQIPQSDPRVARGARNLQCFEPEAPPGRRAATIYDCRGAGTPERRTIGGSTLVPNPAAGPGTDLLGMLSGQPPPSPPPKELTWQSLLLPGTTAQ